jgi:signal transduction histidine kinase
LLNSIQAIGSAGEIRVIIARHNDYAAVSVADTGSGIAPEHLANIFRPFYTTKGNGTGLGLSLASRIVEDHGGRIEVSSNPGESTTFVVLLPLHQPRIEFD